MRVVLCSGGVQVVAASLANPECRVEELHIGICHNCHFLGDKEAAIVAESLRNNQRAIKVTLTGTNITETGWNAFLPILCNPASINDTHGSNHTLRVLGSWRVQPRTSQDVRTMLELNSDQDKGRVAARKILLTHRHLDMKPLVDWKLALLPHVVAWLERFAESRLDLKLSSICEFVRAMPMDAVVGEAAEEKGKKRRRSSFQVKP